MNSTMQEFRIGMSVSRSLAASGKVLIWEHFGLATKREYMSDAVHKLAHYAENGLVHGRNFIMTYESERVPLNVSTVRLMIDTYLR